MSRLIVRLRCVQKQNKRFFSCTSTPRSPRQPSLHIACSLVRFARDEYRFSSATYNTNLLTHPPREIPDRRSPPSDGRERRRLLQ